MKYIKNALLLLVFISFQTISAQYTDQINSNRPGASISAFSVGKRVVQFEAGLYYLKENHDLLTAEIKGIGADFAVRYGFLKEQLEVNVEGVFQRDDITITQGFNPFEDMRSNFRNLTASVKYLVYDPYKPKGKTHEEVEAEERSKINLYSWRANRRFKWSSLIPAVSVSAGIHYDTKNNPYIPYSIISNQRYDGGISPRVLVATQNNLSGGWVFVTNFMMNRIGTDFNDFQYILTLTHSFDPSWSVFGEIHGIKGDFYADNLFRFGGAYLWGADFQLDAGVTLNTKNTPSVFNVNLGASYRLDFHTDRPATDKKANKESRKRLKAQKKKAKKQKKRDKKAAKDSNRKTKRIDSDFEEDDGDGI